MRANLRYHRAMSKSLQSRLFEAAVLYLGRYEASIQSLRRVLKRRVERWARNEQWEIEEVHLEDIEAIIVKLRRIGAIDDARYAETKVRSLHRGGRSGRAIRSYLAMRGVDGGIVDEVFAGRGGESDYEAALCLARKKRLGRFRPPDLRAERRDKDLAALGRAGFSWEVARRVVDQEE